MTIVLCGGGSGGHITPLLAVAAELRALHPEARLVYVGEKGGKFTSIAADSRLFDEHHYISAGKLRRYHGESLITKLLDVKTGFLNARDLFRFLAGTVQSYFLLRKLKPNAILLKGGFVCVPIAFGARLTRAPYITHDSDALPGLSNRIAARWARYHAVALPAEYYSYPKSRIRVVGVPTDQRFRVYSAPEQAILRGKYDIPADAQVILITGGSNGARRMNEAIISILPQLLKKLPRLYALHQVGAGNDDQVQALPKEYKSRVHFFDFSSELFHMSAIADVVIGRAGASAMADLAAQSKACIVIPNPFLTGGHQLRNAEVYADAQAARIVLEGDMLSDSKSNLYNTIIEVIGSPEQQLLLGANLRKLTPKTSAARSLADLLIEVAR